MPHVEKEKENNGANLPVTFVGVGIVGTLCFLGDFSEDAALGQTKEEVRGLGFLGGSSLPPFLHLIDLNFNEPCLKHSIAPRGWRYCIGEHSRG